MELFFRKMAIFENFTIHDVTKEESQVKKPLVGENQSLLARVKVRYQRWQSLGPFEVVFRAPEPFTRVFGSNPLTLQRALWPPEVGQNILKARRTHSLTLKFPSTFDL